MADFFATALGKNMARLTVDAIGSGLEVKIGLNGDEDAEAWLPAGFPIVAGSSSTEISYVEIRVTATGGTSVCSVEYPDPEEELQWKLVNNTQGEIGPLEVWIQYHHSTHR